MEHPLQQREGLRGAIKAIPPVFWFGAASLLLHLALLLLWTQPSLNFQLSEGNVPVHVEIMGQIAAAQSSQPVSSSPHQPLPSKPIAPERPQQTAQPENIAAPSPSPSPTPTPKTSVQHKPAVQTAEAKPEPETSIRPVKKSPSAAMPSSPPAKAPALVASAATQIESPLASEPKTLNASTDSVSKTEVDQPVTTNVANAKLDEDAEAATADRLKLHIREALATHFRYPLIARKRGWQGEVLLSFDVDSDGRISHVQVSRSSGYRALDEAALRALDQVGRVEQAPLVRVSLQLPVTYQLKS
jgi:periplasmic protein TonB